MADLIITAANVAAVLTGAFATQTETGTAGATVVAGRPVYRDASDGYKLKHADADASAAAAAAVGIALHGALDEQPLTFAVGGDLNPGGVMTLGKTYVVSATAGGIAPIEDLASLSWVTHLGVATATTNLRLKINASGVQVP